MPLTDIVIPESLAILVYFRPMFIILISHLPSHCLYFGSNLSVGMDFVSETSRSPRFFVITQQNFLTSVPVSLGNELAG